MPDSSKHPNMRRDYVPMTREQLLERAHRKDMISARLPVRNPLDLAEVEERSLEIERLYQEELARERNHPAPESPQV